MKRKALMIMGLALIAGLVLAAIQPALGSERIVKLRITGCA